MKRTTATISLIAVLLLGLFAFGCGGDDDSGDGGGDSTGTSVQSNASQEDQDGIQAVAAKVREYTKTRDAAKMCSLFEPDRLAEFMSPDQCVTVFKRAMKNKPQADVFTIEGIDVDEDIAKVTFSFGDTYFQKIDGTWYLGTPDVGADDQSE